MCQVEPVEPLLPGDRLSHAAEDLAGDDPGVAARAHQRAEADGGGDAICRLAGDGLRLVQRGTDRGEHVRSGVTVRHRVHVQAVDLIDVRLEVRDGGPERVEQALAVAGAAGHLGDVRPAVGEVAGTDALDGECGR